jgi:hypothetical protein
VVANFRALIHALAEQRVEFVVIGGVALVIQGAPRTTVDLDVCYARTDDNFERIARALAPLHPYLRGVPPGLPFTLDAGTLRAGLNFTLTSDCGDIDLLGELAGVGGYAQLWQAAVPMRLYDRDVLVASLDQLEQCKRAAGRIKDLSDLAYIAELRKRQ